MDTVKKYTYIVVKWLFNHYYGATYGRKELILKELRDLNEATQFLDDFHKNSTTSRWLWVSYKDEFIRLMELI